MEKVVRKFSSFEEADRADLEFYAALTPEKRIEIFLQLLEMRTLSPRFDGAPERLERVARVSQLELR
jgi:hypothetical protein